MLPSIKGDPGNIESLRAFSCRLVVLEIDSCFNSDSKAVDVSKKVFVEDANLIEFLESPQARLAYVKQFLIPFIKDHSPDDCRRLLLNPLSLSRVRPGELSLRWRMEA